MKRPALLFAALLLLVSSSLAQQTPVVGLHPAAAVKTSATSSVTVSAVAGDLLIVVCMPSPKGTISISASSGDVFTALPAVTSADSSGMLGAWARAKATSSSIVLTCSVPAAISSNQIYTAVVSQGGNPKGVPASGPSGSATATIASVAGDLVLAAGESGAVNNATGWTALSTLNSNLLASITATGPTTGSFSASAAWNLLLIDIPPSTAVPPPPPPPPPPTGPAVATFACTPGFPAVTFSAFVPKGAKGYTFSIQNYSTVPLTITSIATPLGFVMDATPALPVTIAVGDAQTFTVYFVPTSAGNYWGNVTFSANVDTGNFLMGVNAVAK